MTRSTRAITGDGEDSLGLDRVSSADLLDRDPTDVADAEPLDVVDIGAARRRRGRIRSGAVHRDEVRRELANRTSSASARQVWTTRYRYALILTDLAAAGAASALAYSFRFGDHSLKPGPVGTGYMVFSAVLPLVWILFLALGRAYEARFLGTGPHEFQRVWLSFVYLTATVAIVSYATRADLARGFVLLALPLSVVFDLLARYGARKVLHRRRRHGKGLARVVVVGDAEHAADMARAMLRDPSAGLVLVGACLPTASGEQPASLAVLAELGVPVLGELDEVLDVVHGLSADAVAVTASNGLGPDKLRWISWQLEGTGIDLVVAPGLIEVTGRRLHVRPISGLPLLQVEAPRFSGFGRLVKGAFDRFVAASALLLLSPLVMFLALLVRLTSRGPAFFRQTRVGRDGTTFTMIKFRSMYADAEDRLTDLLGVNEAADGLLFKIRDDPRVTPVGRILRKFSLDELPQLINVLTGGMSLVGPRPPLPSEVAQYGDDVRRRLLVKPGVTGLWQVSGRSDLSWEESVRLDLRYVENWSLATDLLILWKTLWAVAGSSGAY